MKTHFFLDLENIHFGVAAHVPRYQKFTRIHPRVVNIQALKTLLDLQIGKGQGTVIADLSHMTNYMQDLATIGWSVTQNSFGSGARKNASDIAMTIQVMLVASKIRKPATFVLISGDGDFAPLVWYLRQQQHAVHVVSCTGTTAKVLNGVADSVIEVPAMDLMLEEHKLTLEIPKIELPPAPKVERHEEPDERKRVGIGNLFTNPIWVDAVVDRLKAWEKSGRVQSAGDVKASLKAELQTKAQVVLREADVFNTLVEAGLLRIKEVPHEANKTARKLVSVTWSAEAWHTFKEMCSVPGDAYNSAIYELPNVDVRLQSKAWPNAMLDSEGWERSLTGLLQQTKGPVRLWRFKNSLAEHVCARHGKLNYTSFLSRALCTAGLLELEEMVPSGKLAHVRWSEDKWQDFVQQVQAVRIQK